MAEVLVDLVWIIQFDDLRRSRQEFDYFVFDIRSIVLVHAFERIDFDNRAHIQGFGG